MSVQFKDLEVGDSIGNPDEPREVLAIYRKRERVVGDSYAWWVAICWRKDAFHQFVVWDVFGRPEGFSAANGDYCYTLEKAQRLFESRCG